MRKFRTTIMLGIMSAGLAACSCPQKDIYTGGPYSEDRTAGSGTSFYRGSCAVASEPVQVKEPTVQKAEKIFSKQQAK